MLVLKQKLANNFAFTVNDLKMVRLAVIKLHSKTFNIRSATNISVWKIMDRSRLRQDRDLNHF